MLIDSVPSEHPRRTLTLIAKMLQNLANKPSYAKEPYMARLSPFVTNNKDRINRFLNDLCEVGDFYESLEMDNYVALSKKDLELNITLNEIYATHSLLEKNAGELVMLNIHLFSYESQAYGATASGKRYRTSKIAP
jgi:Ras GTPase-activating-like protein IQGAP2/3